MTDITKAEMRAVRTLVKSPEVVYTSHSLARVIGVTPMGALKILKRLEHDSLLLSRKIGNATIYRIDTNNTYARQYVTLILAREAHHAPPQAKRWITELTKIRNADIIILFGSVLTHERPADIDVLLVTNQAHFSLLQKEIQSLNQLNIKKIHPLYQTVGDLIENIKKKHKPILHAIKGIIIRGEEKFLEVYNESRKE